MNENWKPIPGFEGCYEVSDLGNVRSLDRAVLCGSSRRASAYTGLKKGRVLRPGRAKSGHLTVVLGRGAGSKCVHALVLLAFVGPRPDNHEGCHNNGDPSDNRLSNLRYGTRSENNIDSSMHGTRGKLNPEAVRDIRAMAQTRGGMTAAAHKYGIAVGSAHRVVKGRCYGWVS